MKTQSIPATRRKAIVISAALLFSFLCAFKSIPQQKPAPAWEGLKAGDYVRLNYLLALEQTHSPLKAWRKVDGLEMISISRDASGVEVSAVWNWHEGDGPARPDRDGKVHLGGETYVAEVLNPTNFLVSDGKSKLEFRYVGDWQKWANSIVIAGDYKDAAGAKYSFSADGKAEVPGSRFDYKVSLDQVLSPYDYIDSEGQEKTWAVVCTKDGIELFDVDLSGDNPAGTVAKKPRWTLKRVQSPATQ